MPCVSCRAVLVPKPRLIEGESRFEINVNVRSLVRETQSNQTCSREPSLRIKRLRENCHVFVDPTSRRSSVRPCSWSGPEMNKTLQTFCVGL